VCRLAAGALLSSSAASGGGAAWQRTVLLPALARALEDSLQNVREAAAHALMTAARAGAPQRDAVRRSLAEACARPAQVGAILGAEEAEAPSLAAPPARALKPTRAAGGTLRTAPAATDAAAQAADAPRPLAFGSASAADGLVPAVARRCGSERELGAEVEALAAALAPEREWDVRMAALARLEGLLLGGAPQQHEQAFCGPMLRALRDPLLAQLADRRSAVVRQATHLLEALARALGPAMEATAEALLPALFGVVIISIKVMSDAGCAAGRVLLRHCCSAKLALRCAEAARADRNARLRCAAFDWLALALGEWPEAPLERCLGALEEALRCGAGDADAGARAEARRCAAQLALRFPDAFARLLARCDAAAGKRLLAAAAEAGAGGAQPQPPRCASAPGGERSAALAAARSAARAMRAAGPAEVVVMAKPRSSAAPPPGPAHAQPRSPPRPASAPASRTPAAVRPRAAAGGSPGDGWAALGDPLPPPPPPVGTLAASFSALSRCAAGEERAEALDSLSELLLRPPLGALAEAGGEPLCALLSAACEQAGACCEAALRCARACALGQPQLLPPAGLHSLLPALFARLVDAREPLRAAASAALAALGGALPAAQLLPPLLRALQAAPSARQKTGCLEFALTALLSAGAGPAAGAPLRAWAAELAPLASERHAGLRAAAIANLVALHERCDGAALPQLLAALPAAEAAALHTQLLPFLPGLAPPQLLRRSPLPAPAPPAGRALTPPARRAPPSPAAAAADEAALGRALEALAGEAPAGARRTRALAELRRALGSAALLPALRRRAGALGGALASSLAAGGAEAEAALECAAAAPAALAAELLPPLARPLLRLACAGAASGAPAGAAEAALEALAAGAPAPAALRAAQALLAQPLPAAGPAGARALPLRCLSLAVQRSAEAALQPQLPALLPPLLAALGCDASEVRKCAVFALVDLYLAVGEALRPHLQPLSAAQSKLLDIYIARAVAAAGAA